MVRRRLDGARRLFDNRGPNSADLDTTFQQFQWVGEVERRYQLLGQPGKIAITGFLTRGRMGTFADAIALAQITGGPANIAAVRQYRSRGGVSLNLEQQITEDSACSPAPAGLMAMSNPTILPHPSHHCGGHFAYRQAMG